MSKHDDVMTKLVGMAEMCGDIPPTPEQWKKFVEYIQAEYAQCVTNRLTSGRYTPTYADLRDNYPRGPYYSNAAVQDDVARAIGQFTTALDVQPDPWHTQAKASV